MRMSPRFVAFLVCLILGLYFLFTGSLIIGLVLIGFAVLIPAA